MFLSFSRHTKVIFLGLLALVIKLASLNPAFIERYYALGIYPAISSVLRTLFGWLPLSIGDIFYATAAVYLIIQALKFFKRWQKASRKLLLVRVLRKCAIIVLSIYITFQLLWGLNYSRQGIAAQIGLDIFPYATRDLHILAEQLRERLAQIAPLADIIAHEKFDEMVYLQQQGLAAYSEAEKKHPFLSYRRLSVKPSLFSSVGHFVGFTGYYNPFTGEAQIKTSIPSFLKPFVVAHEMAHQLGYAKESEANFVAFLAGRESANADVRYAIYFEMFLYTLSDLRRTDSVGAKKFREAAPPQVQRDLKALAAYLEKSRNPVEPYIGRIYDAYLRLNSQPKGTLSYNEVVGWLVAYGKKWGRSAI